MSFPSVWLEKLNYVRACVAAECEVAMRRLVEIKDLGTKIEEVRHALSPSWNSWSGMLLWAMVHRIYKEADESENRLSIAQHESEDPDKSFRKPRKPLTEFPLFGHDFEPF